jgi:hypothetical protein
MLNTAEISQCVSCFQRMCIYLSNGARAHVKGAKLCSVVFNAFKYMLLSCQFLLILKAANIFQ